MVPPMRVPVSTAAFTAMAPGVDWAMAAMSSISSSSIQPSSSTKRRFIRVTITKPPPKVKLLMVSILVNRIHSLFLGFWSGVCMGTASSRDFIWF